MNLTCNKLNIFPLTGGPAVESDSHIISCYGPVDDHRLVLTHENRRFDTKLTTQLFATSVSLDPSGKITISFPKEAELDPVDVERGDKDGPLVEINEFGDDTPCIELGDDYSGPFSEFLKKDVHLLEKTEDWMAGRKGPSPEDRAVAPLHFIFGPTLRAFYGHVKDGAGPLRFRHFGLLEGTEEVGEEFGLIGKTCPVNGIPVKFTRPTDRCLATTMDPKNGNQVNDLRTLFSIFKQLGKPNSFGLYGYAQIDEPQLMTVAN